MNNTKIINFFGSLLVVGIAIGIFLMLMSTEMPTSNRELLIAFVSVLFGAMSSSLKNITGDESNLIQELQRKNSELIETVNELRKRDE
jgi:ABC-type enterochelin transport system permease subunit